MRRPKILAVDDEPSILRIIKDSLDDKYEVLVANNAREAIATALNEKPDLILVDNIMPGMSGLEMVKLFRRTHATSRVPIVMITALKESVDRIEAYKSGVDDFISKPFHPDELVTRVESKLQRFQTFYGTSSNSVLIGNLKADFENRHIEINGKRIHLTNIEMGILKILISEANAIVSRSKFLELIWADDQPDERLLDIHIATLRKKIRAFDHKIETIYGKGYVIRGSLK